MSTATIDQLTMVKPHFTQELPADSAAMAVRNATSGGVPSGASSGRYGT
jgi:hypothetical protein